MTASGPQSEPTVISLRNLAEVLGSAAEVHGNAEVRRICYDSRQVQPGDLFAALPGADYDGHNFIPKALQNGASAVLCERLVDESVPCIVVDDSRKLLAPLANHLYGYPSREVIPVGITGTDGKTTTSYLLHGLLTRAGFVTGLMGTVEIRIGNARTDRLPHQTTPESNLVQGYLREMVDAGVSHAILEATSHGLHMHRLDGVEFQVAGVTNITHEHLEYHGTIENYRRAKAILVERVAEFGGSVVLNADDEGAMSLAPIANSTNLITCSAAGRPAHLRARNSVVRSDGSTFDLVYGGDSRTVRLPLIGEFNIANALCAAGMALALGLDLDAIAEGLHEATGVPGRMVRVDEGQPFTVVVDYAHTPESLSKILTLLRVLHPDGRLIVVTGSGGRRDETKRPLQGAVCARLAEVSVFTNEDPRTEDAMKIIRDITVGAESAGGVVGESVFEIEDRREAIAFAFGRARAGDCVLLAGKGHERSIIIGESHTPWDEEVVAREMLRAQRT